MSTFETFLQLHQNLAPLLIGNSWDVNTAKRFERHGFKAIATSSAAVANAFGYEDGEQLPFEHLIRLAKRITEVIRIPLSVDMEGGYSRSAAGIIANIEKLHDAGVAGINLEDTRPGSTRQLLPADEFHKTLSTIAAHLSRSNMKIFLNIRTDGFLLGMPDALEETVTRIERYESAGANGIFVPCIVRAEDIQAVVKATSLPVNVMCMPGLPDFNVLESLGVKRISMGNFVSSYMDKKLEEVTASIIKNKSFSVLFND